MGKKRDNSTFNKKVALRRLMLRKLAGAAPVVMETHGGLGFLWAACYASTRRGVVFEKDEDKAAHLARQRPAWAVYEGDCVMAIQNGAGAHLEINVLDLDPHGEPWPAIDAFFESERPRAERLWVVVNDGLRAAVRSGIAWKVGSLGVMVQRYGNDLFDVYLKVCQEMLAEKAALAGYGLRHFAGYYCGAGQQVTHYLALLTRDRRARPV